MRDAAAVREFLRRGVLRLTVAVLAGSWLVVGMEGRALGQVRMSQEEALRLAFPDADTVLRRTAYLDEEQLGRARELAGRGVEVHQSVVTYYVGRMGGDPVGVAYFDAHRVRTRREVVMVVVTPDDRIERVEILRFDEPPEYLPPDGWLEQFEGRKLEPSLSTRRGIVSITGATLTARSVTRATRRVLALHRVIRPLGGGGERLEGEKMELEGERTDMASGSEAGEEGDAP